MHGRGGGDCSGCQFMFIHVVHVSPPSSFYNGECCDAVNAMRDRSEMLSSIRDTSNLVVVSDTDEKWRQKVTCNSASVLTNRLSIVSKTSRQRQRK